MDENAAAADASMVLTATTPILKSPPAREEPALNPNQPKARMKHPVKRHGNVMSRQGVRRAVGFEFAQSGPQNHGAGKRGHAAGHVNDR